GLICRHRIGIMENQATHRPANSPSDAEQIAQRLQQHVSGEVRFDGGSRALYATDGSLYRQVPIGIVTPRTIEDVEKTLAICAATDTPVTARGAGTSLAGQTCNVAVIIDFSRYLNQLI